MRPLALALVSLLVACGGAKPVPDAGPGIDTSCGIDCAAQTDYGLLANTCFEYSSGNATATPPDLGVAVEGAVALEGGQTGLRAIYFRAGQRLLEDTYLLADGNLKLARRADPRSGTSVSYVNDNQELVGVTLVQADSAAGQNFTDNVTAVAGQVSDPTVWRGNVFAATTSEQNTPAQAFPDALAFTYTETPEHGLDPRRVFVRQTGFIQLNTRLSLLNADPANPYKLQAIRELTAETLSSCGSAP